MADILTTTTHWIRSILDSDRVLGSTHWICSILDSDRVLGSTHRIRSILDTDGVLGSSLSRYVHFGVAAADLPSNVVVIGPSADQRIALSAQRSAVAHGHRFT